MCVTLDTQWLDIQTKLGPNFFIKGCNDRTNMHCTPVSLRCHSNGDPGLVQSMRFLPGKLTISTVYNLSEGACR
jgi:hypothetical protein